MESVLLEDAFRKSGIECPLRIELVKKALERHKSPTLCSTVNIDKSFVKVERNNHLYLFYNATTDDVKNSTMAVRVPLQ